MKAPVILAHNGRPARQELRAQWAYEAAQYSRKRSNVWLAPTDSNKELDSYTRSELVKHSKNLWRNSPLIRGLIERMVTFTVGEGFIPIPASSDRVWNGKAQELILRWSKNPCLSHKWRFGQWQRVITRARFLQGEAFTIKTSSPSGRCRIQSLPPHRIRGGPETSRAGIVYDKIGRPETYWIDANLDPKNPKPYAAENVVHHLTPLELGQERGEPILAAAINTARDVDDILAFEKEAVKDASSKKDVIQTGTGELEVDEEDILNEAASADENAETFYRRKFGAETTVLRWGDEFKPYIPARPGPAWTGFMDFLANTVCLSANVPPAVLLPIKLGGAADRRDLAAAGRTFEVWQGDLISEFQEVLEYMLQAEIDDGPLMNPPEDWNLLDWQTPKHITVDYGRDAAQDREDVRGALMSRREYWGRQGQSGEAQEKLIIAEASRRRQWIKDAGMTLEEFVNLCSLDVRLFSASKPAETALP